MTEQGVPIEALSLARQVAAIASDAHATDVLVLDIQHLSPITDYFVICSADNLRLLRAMAETIQRELREEGVRPERAEGVPETGWVVLDYGSVIVHLFTTSQREFYRLDELWSDAHRLLVIQ
ncbi:MAG: ribosome silencing factor [Thermomicrobiaceae bacterium]|nr:ribosome silencing factor [Thermomicrobiaceae bacterium]